VVSPVPASFVPCVQVPSPFGTGGALWFQQVGTTVTLTLVRPLVHATHAINTAGTTSVVYATGPSTATSPLGKHVGGNAVRVRWEGCLLLTATMCVLRNSPARRR